MWIIRSFRMAHARSSAARAEIRRLCAKSLSGRLHGWQEGIEPKLFRRMKNALYGMRLRMLDVPDLYARQEIASVFAGEHYLDFAGLFDTIHAEDVQEMFRRWAQPNRSTMSVVEPK